MSVGQQSSDTNRRNQGEDENWDTLKNDVGDIADAAVEQGWHFIDAAREQATDYADRRKSDVAQSVADFATSLRESTRSFDSRPNIQAVVDSAAEGLEHLADSIRDRSFADIFNDVENVARQRPATVAAVSVAIGFLAARFIKSTAEDLREDAYVTPRSQGTKRGARRNQASQSRNGNATT
ncbi:hypothetical protein [Microvirga rosea]|uniref:hypothetical protein n=1 Tax=Microvirga rosea TaxID=2715425 RepID=UPI001D0B7EF5|nr:hypothetical protein [Microvirga rosea]MCB8821665.1 hypothetical protein [Microvirga rosea]